VTTIGRHLRSASLVRVAGIDVRMHWTFLLLLAWIFASHVLAGHGLLAASEGVALAATIFACVVLHELGHALTARRFGVRTRDITLYPIGGVARLDRVPERPAEELWIAVAGPAVNFAIAAVLWLVIDRPPSPDKLELVGGSFLAKVMYVNLSIGLFNLLPAFPMDGGRVLRAALAMRMPYVRATRIAAAAGKGLAVLLGLAGTLVNPFLLFIALFVFVAAEQEATLVQTRAALEGVAVTEAMVTRFQTIDADMPLWQSVSLLLSSDQDDFPVLREGRVAGMLTRTELLRALAANRGDAPVHSVMTAACEAAETSEMLDRAFRRMQESGCSSLPVVRQGELVGLITLEHIAKWLAVRGVLERGPMHGARATA
jgi:Zn-dependent protease/CBS domain-containing protein